jgi:hypothetical protein
MKVRIRLSLRPSRRRLESGARRTALVSAALLTPVALMAWVLGGWRLLADLKWTGEFAIQDGLFSHWQVWIALGVAVQFASFLLARAGRRDEDSDGAAFG